MGKRKRGWTAVGERWLEKISCSHCKGLGKKTSREKIQCTQCNGIGYLEGAKKNEVLCQRCKGQRVIAKKSEIKCNECKGKGYLPKIMQRFIRDETCVECSGEGQLIFETENMSQCAICDGLGWLNPPRIYSLADWKKSPDHERVVECDGIFRSKSGMRLYFETCLECHNYPEAPCNKCLGARKMVAIHPGCSECCSTGLVPECKKIKCRVCDGFGSNTVYDERVV
jgi:DnaJ-class molecular chaperone